jgi:hypothetical protein
MRWDKKAKAPPQDWQGALCFQQKLYLFFFFFVAFFFFFFAAMNITSA